MDVVCGVATPAGRGGISVIRISGEGAIDVCARVFRAKREITAAESHTVTFGRAVDLRGTLIDRCLCAVFREPHSFTGEDVCEISCHGGALCTQMILDALISAGARIAQKGEFTKRAFLNGKMSLSQAEAVKDVIDARTGSALWVAVNRMEGELSGEINAVRDKLLHALASVQADSDFPDEETDLSAKDLKKALEESETALCALLESARRGILLREGAVCAIAGKPNAGKSSLFNALVNQSRAIVTDIPGTTRDIVEEWLDIEGIPVKLGDTAGIRESGDEIEKIGVARARDYIKAADLCVFVTEAGQSLNDEEKEILDLIKEKAFLFVVNKIDLAQKDGREGIKVSTVTGEGIGELKKQIGAALAGSELRGAALSNARQKEAVARALEAVKNAGKTLEEGFFPDLTAIDLTDAVAALGEVEGKNVSEETIDRIFEEFCLGK